MKLEQEYKDWMELGKLSPRTQKEYEYYGSKLKGFKQKDFNRFLKQNNNNVARAFLRGVKEFLQEKEGFSDEQRLRISDLMIKKMRGSDRNKRTKITITNKEFYKLASNSPNKTIKCMFSLSYYCALRISELLSISFESFNMSSWLEDRSKHGVLTIKGKRGKIRSILVPEFVMQQVVDLVIELQKKRRGFNKESLMFPFTYRQWIHKLGKLSKRHLGKHISSHVFRRSFATHLVEKGWDILEVKEFLGHEDIKTTEGYITISKKHLEKKYTDLFE